MSRDSAAHVALVVFAAVGWSITRWLWGPDMGALVLWCCILGHVSRWPAEDS